MVIAGSSAGASRRLTLRRAWRLAALAPLLAALAGCGSAGYYWQSVHGHLALMQAARPVNELLADPAVAADLRARLVFHEPAHQVAHPQIASAPRSGGV